MVMQGPCQCCRLEQIVVSVLESTGDENFCLKISRNCALSLVVIGWNALLIPHGEGHIETSPPHLGAMPGGRQR